jgi:hypothetical protein
MGYVSVLIYKLFETYKDSASPKREEDQFLRWLSVNNKTIKNTGGIRPRYFDYLENYKNYPAFIVLATDDRPGEVNLSEWEDIIDIDKGKILYWGDAKYNAIYEKHGYLAFFGNKNIQKINKIMQKNLRNLIPPIFHFMKKKKGFMFFTGVYLIEEINVKEFFSKNKKIQNYQISLDRIDIPELNLNWVYARTNAKDINDLTSNNPNQWNGYINNNPRSVRYGN